MLGVIQEAGGEQGSLSLHKAYFSGKYEQQLLQYTPELC